MSADNVIHSSFYIQLYVIPVLIGNEIVFTLLAVLIGNEIVFAVYIIDPCVNCVCFFDNVIVIFGNIFAEHHVQIANLQTIGIYFLVHSRLSDTGVVWVCACGPVQSLTVFRECAVCVVSVLRCECVHVAEPV